MVVDFDQQPILSFNDKLLGGGVAFPDGNLEGNLDKNESDFELMDGDVNKSMVNGIPTIDFSDRIKDLLFKEMELTVIFKLLGRNIGYNALHNRILNLWKPVKTFHLMDITIGYFLVKFQDIDDYNKVLLQGPWIIFGQYLTVQPWTKSFNPAQPYPSVVMAWMRLSGLSGYLYKRQIIEAIGGFWLMASCKGLNMRPSTVCFSCGKYGQTKELCLSVGVNLFLGSPVAAATASIGGDIGGGGERKKIDYGP
ncbi:uncharacterized protein [Gossypium hirsutum]|uniref:DUF4283 domain-containing protein n=1 Tax=Gossypium hirsutum TaxID=3635 RepID=A0A1U8PNI9_GOSHI|nr:uncharacterized protein LOC107961021 [Gossypium hirsutum]